MRKEFDLGQFVLAPAPIISAVRKIVLLFLLAFLPLQLTWAVGGDYCQHEAGAVAAFWDHSNVPQRTNNGQEKTQMGKTTKPAASLADLDCATCHGACAVAPLPIVLQWAGEGYGGREAASPYRLHHSAAPLARRDRPQWPLLLNSAEVA